MNPYVGPYRITNEELGEGSTGQVRIAVKESDTTKAAVKIVCKRARMNKDQEQRVIQEAQKEINLLQKLQHKNIIKLLHIEEDENYIFIFSEFLEEGDLYSYIQRNGHFDELRARRVFRQMVEALQYCHEQKVCHHDFKLENCVINSDLDLRVIDFGYAVDFENYPAGELLHHYTGSPAYSAIEILDRRPHTESVDVFSLGTSLYFMLAGKFPFCDEEKTTYEQLCRNVRVGFLEFPETFSFEVQDLLKKMLSKESARISWKEIKKHPWMKQEKYINNMMFVY